MKERERKRQGGERRQEEGEKKKREREKERASVCVPPCHNHGRPAAFDGMHAWRFAREGRARADVLMC